MLYEYTGKCLGSRQPPHNRKIILCSLCGQRGTDDGLSITVRNGVKYTYQTVTHSSHLVTVAGVRFNNIDSYCTYEVGAQSLCPA